MDHWKVYIEKLKAKPYSALGLLVLLAIPVTLMLVFRSQYNRGTAALPDSLEAESGILTTGAEKMSDSGASGGQYVQFNRVSNPTPTSPPTSSSVGPRPAPAVPTGSNVVYIPSTINDSNSGDVGSALQSFINSVPNGSIVVFDQTKTAQGFVHGQDTPSSIYRMKNGIVIDNKSNLTLWGYNTKFVMTGTDGSTGTSAFWIEDATNTKILGFEVEGANTYSGTGDALNGLPGQWSMGVGHRYVSNGSEIADMWIHHVNGDAIYTACWGTWPDAGEYHWHHNLLELTARQGITLNQTKSALIENNIIRDTGLYNIDGEDCKDGTQKLNNVVIRNNEIARAGWHAEYGAHSISFEYDWNDPAPPALADFGPITIENNYWSDAAAPTSIALYGNCGIKPINFTGPDGTRGHDLILKDNQFNYPSANRCGTAAQIEDFDRVTVTNNNFQGMNISITNSTSVTNSGNK